MFTYTCSGHLECPSTQWDKAAKTNLISYHELFLLINKFCDILKMAFQGLLTFFFKECHAYRERFDSPNETYSVADYSFLVSEFKENIVFFHIRYNTKASHKH